MQSELIQWEIDAITDRMNGMSDEEVKVAYPIILKRYLEILKMSRSDDMTYADILKEFQSKFPDADVEDYRPACGLYIDGMDDCEQIPNAIVVWLTDGSKVVYISK